MQEGKIKLLIADDSNVFRQMLIDFFEDSQDIEIVGVADNGEDAFNMIKIQMPDVVVLDILMPVHDGLWVLEELQTLGLDRSVKCIVATAIDNDNIAKSAMYSGASYYMIKPFSLEVMERRIRQVAGFPVSAKNAMQTKTEFKTELVEQIESISGDIDKTVTEILGKMHISASIKGYHYLRKGIIMAVEDESAVVGITKRLYPDIAKNYATSPSKVERAIRHAIESCWNKGGCDFYNKILEYDFLEKPTNGHLIASLSQYIRQKNKK